MRRTEKKREKIETEKTGTETSREIEIGVIESHTEIGTTEITTAEIEIIKEIEITIEAIGVIEEIGGIGETGETEETEEIEAIEGIEETEEEIGIESIGEIGNIEIGNEAGMIGKERGTEGKKGRETEEKDVIENAIEVRGEEEEKETNIMIVANGEIGIKKEIEAGSVKEIPIETEIGTERGVMMRKTEKETEKRDLEEKEINSHSFIFSLQILSFISYRDLLIRCHMYTVVSIIN